jgi:hypothetical protein
MSQGRYFLPSARGAKGIDRQVEACASKLNIPCKIIRPDHAGYPKGVPLKRNLQIIKACDALLVIKTSRQCWQIKKFF